jgi:lipopolysaccharide export system protein LptA
LKRRTRTRAPSCRGSSGARCAAVALLVLAALSGHTRAERGDRDKPVNIEADRLSLDDIKKESVFEGNVQLTQGTLTLRADRVVVRQDEQGFTYAFATGKPAYLRQRREGFDEYIEGFAERLEYNGKLDKVEMFTGARIKRGLDEVRGDYISYDAATEFYQVIGGGPAAATPANPQGRVRAVIQPKRKPDKPQAPDKPAASHTPGSQAPGPRTAGLQAAHRGTPLQSAAALRNPPEQ